MYGDYTWDPKPAGCEDTGGYLDFPRNGTELRCPAIEYNPQYRRSFSPIDPTLSTAALQTNNETAVCTPWHELVGFYWGDDSYTFDNNAEDGPVLNIEEVDYEGSLLGNFIFGSTDTFSHDYTVPVGTISLSGHSESPLWVAFFTGGNRLSTLVNNADGRYRLEVGVKFDFVNGTLLNNRSPRTNMVPLLAVPYVATTADRLGAHFQVVATDQDYFVPELRDEV